ncbi:hypothetical protein BKA70DRAFT_1219146 [Coprinopsis sp. MPI-PUGE-AT-0042]|nr:hypothetical protein BKA70DRAFT_1219146 [Coprinopsis sp. MPI-PUGE-AT-0042]
MSEHSGSVYSDSGSHLVSIVYGSDSGSERFDRVLKTYALRMRSPSVSSSEGSTGSIVRQISEIVAPLDTSSFEGEAAMPLLLNFVELLPGQGLIPVSAGPKDVVDEDNHGDGDDEDEEVQAQAHPPPPSPPSGSPLRSPSPDELGWSSWTEISWFRQVFEEYVKTRFEETRNYLNPGVRERLAASEHEIFASLVFGCKGKCPKENCPFRLLLSVQLNPIRWTPSDRDFSDPADLYVHNWDYRITLAARARSMMLAVQRIADAGLFSPLFVGDMGQAGEDPPVWQTNHAVIASICMCCVCHVEQPLERPDWLPQLQLSPPNFTTDLPTQIDGFDAEPGPTTPPVNLGPLQCPFGPHPVSMTYGPFRWSPYGPHLFPDA